MKTFRYLTGVFVVLHLSFGLRAQDAAADLKELTLIYANASSYSMKVEMSLKSDSPPVKGMPGTFKGWMKKSGPNYISSMAGKTTLLNKECLLLLIEEQKLILYNSPGKNAAPPDLGLGIRDSVFRANARMSYVEAPAGRKKVEVVYNKESVSPYSKIEVTYVPGQYIEDIVFYNRAGVKEGAVPSEVHIRYYDVNMKDTIPASEFVESNFVIRTKKGLEPVVRFKGYRVIDQRTDQKKKN